MKDSRDRYANMEVGYLLQKMEEYPGMTVLASNMRTSMDEAFMRRIHHIVNFPEPQPGEVLRIWKRVFPPEAPLADDIDFEFLSKLKKVTGGLIRNMAVTASLYAAEEKSERIRMVHLIKAIRREYMKIGWPYSKNDMGPYYEMGMPPWGRLDKL